MDNDELLAAIRQRREDSEFMARLDRIMKEHAPVLDRLEPHLGQVGLTVGDEVVIDGLGGHVFLGWVNYADGSRKASIKDMTFNIRFTAEPGRVTRKADDHG